MHLVTSRHWVPPSPSGKRPLQENSEETQLKKKKRESLLSFARNSFENGNNLSKGLQEVTSMAPVKETKQHYTACHLCDLHFLSELELEEHLFSLLHHRALDTENGKDFVHECNLCCVRCKGLSEYVAHLREENHKVKVEKRKEDVDNKRISGPLYALEKYKSTFINPPKKTDQRERNSTPQQVATSSKNIAARSSFNLEKGQLYESRKQTQPSLLGAYPSNSTNKSLGRSVHSRLGGSYGSNSLSRPSYDERGRDRLANGSVNNKRGMDSERSHYGSRNFRNFWYSSYSGDHRASHVRGSSYHQQYLTNFGNPRQSFQPPPQWSQRWYDDYNHGMTNGFFLSPRGPYHQLGPGNRHNDFNSTSDKTTENQRQKQKQVGHNSSQNPSSSSKNKSKVLQKAKTKKLRMAAKKALKSASPSVSPTADDTNSSTSSQPSLRDRVLNKSQSSVLSSMTSQRKIVIPSKKKAKSRNTTKPSPSYPANKVRQNLAARFTQKNLKKKSNASITSPSTPSNTSATCKAATAATVTSSTTSTGKTTTSSALTDSCSTERLREKFRSIIDEINPPSTSRSTSANTCASIIPTVKEEINETDVCMFAVDEEENSGSEDQESSGMRRSSSLSASVVNERLQDLVKRKHEEEEKTRRSTFVSAANITFSPLTSDETIEASKRRDQPKPNLTKARSRLSNKQVHHPTASSDSEGDKQTRLANLMLKTRAKNMSDVVAKKSSQSEVAGPRFGIGVKPRVTEQDLELDESDLNDIVHSIKQVECPKSPPRASPCENNCRMGSGSPRNSDTDQRVSPHKPHKSNRHSSSRRKHSHSSHSSGKLVERSNSRVSPRPRPLSAKQDDDFQSAVTSPTLLPSSVSSPRPALPPLIFPKQPSALSTPLSSLSEESLSIKLLHMSEREELLHMQDSQLKTQTERLNDEINHVNSLISQLNDRKHELQEAIKKVEEEDNKIKKELEELRQSRLNILRVSTRTSGGIPMACSGVSPAPSSGPRPDSCAHSTSTPGLHLDASSPKTSMSFSDSQSTVSERSLEGVLSNPNSKYNTAMSEMNHSVERDDGLVVKNEQGPPEGSSIPSNPAEPFPVASGSVYFDTSASPSDTKPLSSSVNQILHKYLKDASAEREVTSSTTSKGRKISPKNPASCRPSSEVEVSSTTNHQDTMKNPSVMIKTEVESAAPQFASHSEKNLASEQGNLRTTAHNRSCDLTKKVSIDENLSPTTLTSEQIEVACLHTKSLELHTASVVGLYITECGKIISCSKDKTLCVSDASTGALVGKYDLPGVPFKTCFVPLNDKPENLILFVVFVNNANEKGLLASSSLHRVQIKLKSLSSDFTNLRIKKLSDYNSCVMSLHYHNSLLYLGCRDGNVTVFCTTSNQVKDVLDCHSPHAVSCLTTGMDGARRVLCCGSSDCRISVRDANDGLLLKTLLGHSKTINCLQLHFNLLYSGSSDRSVLVHNIQTGDVVYRFLGMHAGSIKTLHLHQQSIVTLCLDKSIRVLKTEPCRISGPPKPLSNLPLVMCLQFHKLGGTWNGHHVVVAYAYVGYQDGKIEVVSLNQLAYKKAVKGSESSSALAIKESTSSHELLPSELTSNLQCMWNGCGASGFTNSSSLLTHICLFHATDTYKEKLNSCCLWGNCTHYFSSDLDSALDVHLHMDKHVSDAVKKSNK